MFIAVAVLTTLTTAACTESEPPTDEEGMYEELDQSRQTWWEDNSVNGVLQVQAPSARADGGSCSSLNVSWHWWGVLYHNTACWGDVGEYCTWGKPWIGEESSTHCTPTSCTCVELN